MIFTDIIADLSGRGASILLGLLLGAGITWLLGRWRRYQERLSIERGDARDTVVIAQHIVEVRETPEGAKAGTLRIRSLGQSELCRVVPNGFLAAVFLHRAFEVTPRHTLVSMAGPEGSYLLETLTNFVCDRVANSPFEHDRFVMAPCSEPAGLATHQPITIVLIAETDLALFEDWAFCRDLMVEHGGDGARVLTLMEMARRHKAEQTELARYRQANQRTRYVETMYVLDLALDTRTAPVPTKKIPWVRFEAVLKEMNLE